MSDGECMKKVKILLALLMGTTVTSYFVKTDVNANVEINQVNAGYLNVDDLDNRVIFQNFSLFQPYEKNMYQVLSDNVSQLKKLGITDVWTAPGYRSFGMSRYMEGYAISDRYDLGEFPQGVNNEKATKYGTSDELKKFVETYHNNGMKVQMDLVPNQMFGMTDRQYTNVNRVDASGNLWHRGTLTKIINQPYFAYTKGSFAGQQKYGLIKQWNKEHFIGTSLQNQGSRVIKGGPENNVGMYYYKDEMVNYLPEELKTPAMLNAFANGKVNLVDGFLTLDGWLQGTDDVWRPILAYIKHTAFDSYISSKGYSKERYFQETSAQQHKLLQEFLNAANYNFTGEEESLSNHESGIDSADQLMFSGKKVTNTMIVNGNQHPEFLIGLDVDYLNQDVKKDMENWVDFLLNQYKFDGFRIDAVTHFDTSVLDMINEKVKARDKGAIAYMETYEESQLDYLKKINNDMLAMNYDLFIELNKSLGYNQNELNLLNLFVNNNRYNTSTPQRLPNWSFVNNHDQEKNVVNRIISAMKNIKQGSKPSFYDVYTKEVEKEALTTYFDDMNQATKKWASHNVLSQYAFMLGMKNTTPTVYYGDMYRGDKTYMSTPTLYHDGITKLLETRKKYAKGEQFQQRYTVVGQTMSLSRSDVITNVRAGVTNQEGMATIISNNENIDEYIRVYVGKEHFGQFYKDALGRSEERLSVDESGHIIVRVKGKRDPLVKGYLGVFVPDLTMSSQGAKADSAHFVGFDANPMKKTVSLRLSVTERGVPLTVNQMQVILRSETTGKEVSIPTKQMKQTKVDEIQLQLDQSQFVAGQTYTLKINGLNLENRVPLEKSYFENGLELSAQSVNGILRLSTRQDAVYVQSLYAVVSNSGENNYRVSVTSTAGGYALDAPKVDVKLVTKFNEVIQLPAGSAQSSGFFTKKRLIITIPQNLIPINRRDYYILIDGRAVAGSSDAAAHYGSSRQLQDRSYLNLREENGFILIRKI